MSSKEQRDLAMAQELEKLLGDRFYDRADQLVLQLASFDEVEFGKVGAELAASTDAS